MSSSLFLYYFNIGHTVSSFLEISGESCDASFISVMLGGMPDAVAHGYKNIYLMCISAAESTCFKKILLVHHVICMAQHLSTGAECSLLKNVYINHTV